MFQKIVCQTKGKISQTASVANQEMKTGQLKRDSMKKKCQSWLKDLLSREPFLQEKLRPIPLLQAEIKQQLKNAQDKDEAEAIKHLAEAEDTRSVAGKIYRAWSLDRQTIRECHIAMSDSRPLQTTLNNIIGATRFKTLVGQRLMRTLCPKKGCNMIDSWEHFCECYEIPNIKGLNRQEKVAAIVNICKRAEETNPVRPRPSARAYWEEDEESTG